MSRREAWLRLLAARATADKEHFHAGSCAAEADELLAEYDKRFPTAPEPQVPREPEVRTMFGAVNCPHDRRKPLDIVAEAAVMFKDDPGFIDLCPYRDFKSKCVRCGAWSTADPTPRGGGGVTTS
jgi:hypothetical protein